MKSQITLGRVCALLAFGLQGSPLWAAMPADRVVKYFVRETPTDPESDVIFVFALKIRTSERDGDSIGWSITEVRLKEPGSPARLWIDDSPTTPTASGLWWIDHADADVPDDSEFAVTPTMQGTADAQDPNDDDMDYDLQGATYSPPPSLYSGCVSSQTFEFTFVQESRPYIDGTDEPVAIDDDEDPPGMPGE